MLDVKTFSPYLQQEKFDHLAGYNSFQTGGSFYVAHEKCKLFQPDAIYGDVTMYVKTLMYANPNGQLTYIGEQLKRKDLSELIALECADKYIERSLKSGLLKERSGALYVEKGAALSRESDVKLGNGRRATAISINGFDYLYRKYACVGNVSILGHLFAAMPFINARFNVLCHNPDELNFDDIIPMTSVEIADALGLCETYSLEFVDDFKDYLIVNNDEEFQTIVGEAKRSPVLNCVAHPCAGMLMVVNPNLIYSGDRYNAVNLLGGF